MNRPVSGFRGGDWDIELRENWGRFPFSPKFKKFRQEINHFGSGRPEYLGPPTGQTIILSVPFNLANCCPQYHSSVSSFTITIWRMFCESLYESSICEYRRVDLAVLLRHPCSPITDKWLYKDLVKDSAISQVISVLFWLLLCLFLERMKLTRWPGSGLCNGDGM